MTTIANWLLIALAVASIVYPGIHDVKDNQEDFLIWLVLVCSTGYGTLIHDKAQNFGLGAISALLVNLAMLSYYSICGAWLLLKYTAVQDNLHFSLGFVSTYFALTGVTIYQIKQQILWIKLQIKEVNQNGK